MWSQNRLQVTQEFYQYMMEHGSAQLMAMGGGMVMGGGGGGGDAAAEEEAEPEKTSFDVKLVKFDASSKIKVIKEVRAVAGLGLKEAKEAVEKVPFVVKSDLTKEEAEELAEKLKKVGGEVELA